jgi:pimeloyl-ACP methyl ester carboxylesterase
MDLCGRPYHPLEFQMSKRKPATAVKHARSPKIAAKAQRAAQAIVRSPKNSRLRSGGAGSTESPPKRPDNSPQEALLVENSVTAIQDDYEQTMTDSDSKMPIVIIAGEQDRLIDIDTQSARLHSDVSQSRFHRVPGNGHMIQQTATDQVMSAIREVASGPTKLSDAAAE